MTWIRVQTAADICGVSKELIISAIREERLVCTGRGEGKVLLRDVVRALELRRCPTCLQFVRGKEEQP